MLWNIFTLFFFRICSLSLHFISLKLNTRYLFPLTFVKMLLKLPQLRIKNIFLSFFFFYPAYFIYSKHLRFFWLSGSFFVVCVCCLSHSNRRKSRDKEEKPLHMGKYELLSNPKNLVHSEELINKLNNTLWKQTLMHKYHNQKWESEGQGNSQHKNESTKLCCYKKIQNLEF